MKTGKSFLSLLMVVIFLMASTVSNAQTQPKKPWSKTAKGGMIGAGAGAVIGGVIGNKKGNTAAGAIIGGAVGGIAGAAIGRYMDKQAEELQRDLKGAKVERVGEGIKITFDSGILFQKNSDKLSGTAMANIDNLAKTLKKYGDTNILIEGHTDADGTEAYNQTLSERRAKSVKSYTSSHGVAAARMTSTGYGEAQPIASNSTVSGKSQNRRVEIAIMANEKLKKKAEKGEI